IELIGTTYYSRPGNINKKVESGVTLNGTFKPTKWWTSVPNIAYIHLSVKSPLYTQQINSNGGFWDLSATNQFTISKTWGAELNAGYRSLITNGQFLLKQQWQLSAGVQKKILKNKGSLKFNIRDIFYTRINYGVIRSLQNGEGKWRNAGDSRVATLAFSYNFGKATGNRKKHDSGGAQSEQSRVN
ncbi:MAG TPA: outer membrane beta-barrel protein, partial [Chitinophagaceae bacterium]|nr:outer membrane beta-barrel protein [Chitinophagaceae bacterium]